MTATAGPHVREEIVELLQMRKPLVLVHGFNRPNIFLRVDSFDDDEQKRAAVLHRIRWAYKPGIVYTGTRKAAEDLVRDLDDEDFRSAFYHGGMAAKDRHAVQEAFMSGEVDVMIATNAFGMGIDKPNVRFVYHYQPSESLDAYYQEIGRAGRDGERAEAILFYRRADLGAQKFKASDDTEEHGEYWRQSLEELAAYAESPACRRETILRWLGDDFTGPCNFCDNCSPIDPSGGTRREVK